MTSKHTTLFTLIVASILCLQTLSAAAADNEAESVNWTLSAHTSTGGPFGVLGLSVQRDVTPWLMLEAGGGYDQQSADLTASLRAGGRAHLRTPQLGQRHKFSLGLFAGLGYDSSEAEQSSSSLAIFLKFYSRTGVYEHLLTSNGGATVNMTASNGVRLGLEVGYVGYLGASRFRNLKEDSGGEKAPASNGLPEGKTYVGINARIAF